MLSYLNAKGEPQWHKRIGFTDEYEYISAMAQTSDGNVYMITRKSDPTDHG